MLTIGPPNALRARLKGEEECRLTSNPFGNLSYARRCLRRSRALSELAYNILWAWEPSIRTLFRRLDPALWKESGYNPVVMLGRVSQSTLERAAADPRYLGQYQLACQRFDRHMQRESAESHRKDGKLIAYFSAEYGLTECMPVYSGGLGVLSGDHMKSSSDLDLPIVGVGLLYQLGYFRQYLNADGWQQERYLENDFYSLPVQPANDANGEQHVIYIQLPAGPLAIRIWTMDVGRIKMLFLDTNTPLNALPEDRAIASQLYGGDTDTRIRQEIVLGIGGMRALEVLGYKPTVFHMNEGHSAFLAIERIRLFIERQKLSVRRGARSHPGEQRFHHPHARPGGHRSLRSRSCLPLLQPVLQRREDRVRALHGPRPPQSAGWR